jgi:hypothetical protein
MTLPVSGAIAVSNLNTELSGGYSLGNYYFGGSYVRPGIYDGTNIPASGPIRFSNFYSVAGTHNYDAWYTLTGNQSNDGVGLSVDYYNNALRINCGYCTYYGSYPTYGDFTSFTDGSQVVVPTENTIYYSSIIKSVSGPQVSYRINANNFNAYFSDGTYDYVTFPAYTRLAAKIVGRTVSIYWNPSVSGIGDAGYDYMLIQLNNAFATHSGNYISSYDVYGNPVYSTAWAYRITI